MPKHDMSMGRFNARMTRIVVDIDVIDGPARGGKIIEALVRVQVFDRDHVYRATGRIILNIAASPFVIGSPSGRS